METKEKLVFDITQYDHEDFLSKNQILGGMSNNYFDAVFLSSPDEDVSGLITNIPIDNVIFTSLYEIAISNFNRLNIGLSDNFVVRIRLVWGDDIPKSEPGKTKAIVPLWDNLGPHLGPTLGYVTENRRYSNPNNVERIRIFAYFEKVRRTDDN